MKEGIIEIKDALIIYSKEIRNILKDKRTLFMTVLLPLFLMPAIFGAIGVMSERQQSALEEEPIHVEVQGSDDPRFWEALDEVLKLASSGEGAEASLSVVFPQGYTPGERGTVTLIYDSSSRKESYAAARVETALRNYQEILVEERLRSAGISNPDLSPLSVQRLDTAPEGSQGAVFLAILLPYMVLIYIFSSSMGVGLDTTSGEKERGSLASLLVNQVSRSSIAVGKVLYVVTISLLNSFSTFLGLMIAFSLGGNFFSGGAETEGAGVMAGTLFLSPAGAFGLLLVLFSISAIIASIVILIGSMARSTKEGGSYILPIYILVIIMGVVTMQMESSSTIVYFFVPLLNAVLTMKGIILGNFTFLQVLLTVGVNLGVVAIIVVGITRLFNSERILTESGA
jgi:sodium transport system permease protein